MQEVTKSQVEYLTSYMSGACAYLYLRRLTTNQKDPILEHSEKLGAEILSEASEDLKLKEITDKIKTVEDAHENCEELMGVFKSAATRLLARWPDDFRIAAGEEVSHWEADLEYIE